MATPRHRRKVRHRELRTQRGDDIWAQNDIVDKKKCWETSGEPTSLQKKYQTNLRDMGKKSKATLEMFKFLELDQAETPKLLASNPPIILRVSY